MTAPLGYIPDILEEHIEELQFLLARRPALARSSRAYRADLAHHDERILAHLDGVLAVGEPSTASLVALLSSNDPTAIHGATFALAHLPVASATDALTSAYAEASGESLVAMADAFLLHQSEIALQVTNSRLHDSNSLARVVSARVHTRHRGAAPGAAWLAELLTDPNPLVRQLVWQLAGETAARLEGRTYADVLRDESADVRREGMIAAARTANPAVLAFARHAAEQPAKERADELRLLAVLGTRQDERRIRYVVTDASLGPLRFELAGLCGAPSLVPLLLDAMRDAEPRTAIAAGDAFRRITGVNVESSEVVTVPPEDGSTPDEFESEFQDDGLLPDAAKARAHWDRVQQSLGDVERLCAGRDASHALDASAFAALDLETGWWQTTRHRFEGWSVPIDFDLEAFRATSGS